jgi:hypothetical protein
MKTIKLLTYMLFITMIGLATSSCEGEAGPAGADGNANVQTYTFDVSAKNGTHWNISASQLTQDVLDNDGILVYLRRSDGSYYPIPGTSVGDEIKVFLVSGTVQIMFYDRITGSSLTPSVGTYTLLKLVIIESSNTTAGKMSSTSQQAVYNELENAGIDINNYYEVCNYYGINPE